MCGCFCIGLINVMSKGKKLQEYTNLFSPNEYENNEKTSIISGKYKKSKNPKILYIFQNTFAAIVAMNTKTNI